VSENASTLLKKEKKKTHTVVLGWLFKATLSYYFGYAWKLQT